MDSYPAVVRPGRATKLTDRDGERDVLDRLASAVRAGESRVLVMRGDPSVGKTVLLDYLARQARMPDSPGDWCSVGDGAGLRSSRAARVRDQPGW